LQANQKRSSGKFDRFIANNSPIDIKTNECCCNAYGSVKSCNSISIFCSIKQALDLESPPQTVKFTGKEIHAFGKTYKSISAAAADLGISAEPFRLRMKKGLTSEEAFHFARKTKK